MTAKSQTQRTTDHRSRRLRVELLLKPDSPEAQALAELVRRHGSQAAAVRYALMFTANAQAFGVVTVPVKRPPVSAERVAKVKRATTAAVPHAPSPPVETYTLPVGPAPVKPGARLKGGKR